MNKFWKGVLCGATYTIATSFLCWAAFSLAQTPVPGVTAIGLPTVVNVGSTGAEVLNWVLAVTVPAVGVVATGWLSRMFQQVGISMSDQMRGRLQEIVVNGLNAGAAIAVDKLKTAPAVDVKNAAVAHAIDYTLAHAGDTLKAMGFDPNDSQTKEAIRARIETAIADPTQPTAAVLGNGKNGIPAVAPKTA